MGRSSRTVPVPVPALVLAAALVLALLPGAAGGEPLEPMDQALAGGTITRDGDDTYALAVDAGDVTARAADGNEGGTGRSVFWRRDDAVSTDHESCASWADDQDSTIQPGAALRATRDEQGTRAITVTKNIYGNLFGMFNVHLMDSGAEVPHTRIGQFSLPDAVLGPDGYEPPPWRMCARVVGDVVSFKVWAVSRPEPAWGDPAYGGSVTLPAGWGEPGRAGWYIGHLGPGVAARFADLTSRGM